jgi:hypothetical protein
LREARLIAELERASGWLISQKGYSKPCYLLLSGYPEDMNISLTDELETVIQEKVKSGLYNNASEVVRDA